MICEIDALTGNLLGKFKASTKAISSMSVSFGMLHMHMSITLHLLCYSFLEYNIILLNVCA